jgi:hypothetical protein
VVGETIRLYSVLPAAAPPTKKNGFEWSLGKEVTRFWGTSGAAYGLFVYIRDSYATAGRKALIVTSALLGVSVKGGSQVGFATLVDRRDGSVVWFTASRIKCAGGSLAGTWRDLYEVRTRRTGGTLVRDVSRAKTRCF